MSAHTPGPWRFIFRGFDQSANWASRIPYAIERTAGSAVMPIADVCDQPQAEANARLICAAPDLLTALQAAQIAMRNIGRQDHLIDYDACNLASHQIAAAIAKATGSAP